MPLAGTQIDLDIVILSEINQTEKEKYHKTSLKCVILKKIDTNELAKQKKTHRLRE